MSMSILLDEEALVESQIIAPLSETEKEIVAVGAETAPVEVNEQAEAEILSERPRAPTDAAFESVWKKALAAEDGLKEADSGKE